MEGQGNLTAAGIVRLSDCTDQFNAEDGSLIPSPRPALHMNPALPLFCSHGQVDFVRRIDKGLGRVLPLARAASGVPLGMQVKTGP
jgi:hypothetical protein